MAPKKEITTPPTIYTPTTSLDPEHEKRIKAEARAYALSGSTSSSAGTKRKSPITSATVVPARKVPKKTVQYFPPPPPPPVQPPSINIRPPERQHKPMAPAAPPMQPPLKLHEVRVPPPKVNVLNDADEDDDYLRFVKSLGLDDSFFTSLDDDEDFHLSDADDDDDDDDDDDEDNDEFELDDSDIARSSLEENKTAESTPPLSSPLSSTPMPLPDFETDMYRNLEEELGSLLEEDLEAAVQSLMTSKNPTTPSAIAEPPTPNSKTPKASGKSTATKASPDNRNESSPATPLRDAARQGAGAQVSYQQAQQLRRLLTGHYQLLVQQAILGVRAAHMQKLNKDKSDFLAGESADDLAEILDGAVGMLQDLDQNRKDAIRNSIQLDDSSPGVSDSGQSSVPGRRSLLSKFAESSDSLHQHTTKDRRLTRAAFSRTLQQGARGSKRTTFDIPGLVKLKETFATIDKSVDGVKGIGNILGLPSHAEACRMVLRQAGANFDSTFIPGEKDLSDNFCDCKEFFGDTFKVPCTEDQKMLLRRNRNLFTSGEDNLVLRGVNLYGEKQWILIADRYLPDRSVNIISQRYSKLCVMLYKANGVDIDSNGNLREPPKLESVDDIDNAKVDELGLKAVDPPAILNVHRWSLEEDLTLLKAVPLMGHMWAELGARLIPHRDRGHLRKRYQVLERRVKATVSRSAKGENVSVKPPKWPATTRKTIGPAASMKNNIAKVGTKTFPPRANTKKASSRKPNLSHLKAPPMSIEKAAASLAFLRPPRTAPAPMSTQYRAAPPPAIPLGNKPYVAPKPNLSIGKGVPKPVVKVKAKKVVPTRKPKQPTPSLPISGAAKRPVPKKPVVKPGKPATPAKSSWAESNLGNDHSSRIAFEQLVDGSEDWSQMSRVRKMLENDAESQAADAIVSHLAKSPLPSNLSKLPHMQLDSDSMSGLSILQSEASRQTSNNNESSKPSFTAGMSIMSRVLEGSSKSSNSEKKAVEEPAASSNSKNSMGSPRKRPSKPVSGTLLPPSTPKRPYSFTSTKGTPIALSPGFRPSPSGLRNGGGIPLTPNVQFSPAPSTIRLNNDRSPEEFRYSDFQISELSQKRFGQFEAHATAKNPPNDPNPPPSTPSKNSLFGEQLMETDLEAISALNSLSNSPFRPQKKPDSEVKESKTEPKKSLFATVVGGLKEKKERFPTQKLEF